MRLAGVVAGVEHGLTTNSAMMTEIDIGNGSHTVKTSRHPLRVQKTFKKESLWVGVSRLCDPSVGKS